MADSSEPLLVPIAAEALVVNAAVQNGTAWRRWQMQYGNLDDFASPTPRPFSESTAPALGIHVRWVLPDALTHGSEVAASATATVTDGQVTSIAVQDGGYGYEAPPLVLFTGGGGSGATATATIVDGVVQTITVNEQGTGFSEAPTVSISASPAIAFPLIPNRWLVVRYGPSPTPTSPRPTKTWLVQSDFVDGALGTSPFVNPNPGTPGAIEATRIGSIITPLSAWDGDDGSTAALFLRAVGPGDATFHAYSPGVANVLSFHDDLDGDLARTADFTYLVVGWYSDPSHDPLYGAVTGWTASRMPVRTRWTTTVEWASLLDTLRWDVQATEALGVDALPDTTMYHALISGVAWNNVTAPSWNGNDVKKMTVAIGNTGADALAALVEHNAGGSLGPVEATALEAFQYGELQTLDRPDGDAQLDLAIHKAWFGSSPGGTVWKVSAIEQLTPSGQVPVVATSAPPSLTPEQAEALAELNRAQTALDEALRRLISLQGQLYDAWWKLQRAGRPAVEANAGQYLDDWQTQVIEPLTEAISPTTPESLYLQVVASEATVGQLAANLPAPTDTAAIAAYATSVLGLDPAGYQLKPAAAPRFYHPVDPVILVSGITVSDAQGTMGDTSGLLCRLATQAATGVAVTVDGVTKPVTPATGTVATAIPVSPSNPALRPAVAAGIAALSLEGFFADPANAAPIVTLGLSSTDAAVIEQLAAAMTAGTAETATIDHPLTVATAFANWRWQPFSPLFLEWDVSYFYTAGDATLQTDNRPFAVVATVPPAGTDVGWVFNGVDYDWYGTNPEGATNTERYAGRT
ncbi:MAG: hypothetical protein ACXV5U_13540, partial [Ilumatobacteraceae bacterium]